MLNAHFLIESKRKHVDITYIMNEEIEQVHKIPTYLNLMITGTPWKKIGNEIPFPEMPGPFLAGAGFINKVVFDILF